MPTVAAVLDALEQFVPPDLAAEWDNVGLLLGDRAAEARRVMTCLTVTPESVAEAVEQRAQLLVSHHPILFRAVKRLTTATAEGRTLLSLIRAGVAVYSPHTAFDNTVGGINDALAAKLGLVDVAPLRIGEGRVGRLPRPTPLGELAKTVKAGLNAAAVQVVGDVGRTVERVAIVCGAGGELLGDAARARADVFLTGEMRFHDYLAAQAQGVALLLPGHYATERFGVEELAERLQRQWPDVEVWASRSERDPAAWV